MCHFFVLQETLLWNGIASKKKGQKWGREKGSCMRNDVEIVYNEPAREKIIPEQGKSVDVHLDFESLFPLTRIPKVCPLSPQSLF